VKREKTTFLHILSPNERCVRRRIIEAAHTNNGDVINDDVILSLEDGRDLMKKLFRKLREEGRWRGKGVYYFAFNNVASPQNAVSAPALVIVSGPVLCCVSFGNFFCYRVSIQQGLAKADVISRSHKASSGISVHTLKCGKLIQIPETCKINVFLFISSGHVSIQTDCHPAILEQLTQMAADHMCTRAPAIFFQLKLGPIRD
jgi:hypothetical protein